MTKKIINSELKDAAPVEAPDSVAQLVKEPATSKRSRKAKLKAGTASPVEASIPDYEALGVAPEKVSQIENLRLRFHELGRKSTEQVFECGEVVVRLQEIAGSQETFTKLAKGVLGLSRRGAENYASVYHHLKPYRERLVRIGMVASALYQLAAAEPEQVERVIAACEAGQMPKGKQMREMLGKSENPSVSPDDGGTAGLKARMAEKTAKGVSELMDNASQLLQLALDARRPYLEGNRIVVKDVQRPFIHLARLVREQLEWLTWVAVPAPAGFAEGVVHHVPIVKGDRWAELHKVLCDLGGYEDWPKAAQVGPWLNDVVVPQLAWLLGDRAKKTFAAAEKKAAAAEAERRKAEEAKRREKAKARKARLKAKLEQIKAERRAARQAKALAKLALEQGEQALTGEPVAPAEA